MSKKNAKPELMPHAGGQAVIEGVLMRSKRFYAIAVRNAKGKILIKKGNVKSLAEKYRFLKWPVLRGFWGLVESMILGYSGLDYSARIYEESDPKAKKKKPKNKAEALKMKRTENIIMGATFIVSLVIAIAVFIYLPVQLTKLMQKALPGLGENSTAFNSVVVAWKFVFFFLYVWGISFMEDIRRLFMYHGAEHMAIYAYEDGRPLTIKNMSGYMTMHPRCGTAFMFITILVSIVVFVLLLPPELGIVERVFWEFPLIPVIAGISYEILKFSDKYKTNPFMKLFIMPGMAFQKLTTKTPDAKQLAVAAIALKTVVAMEKQAAKA